MFGVEHYHIAYIIAKMVVFCCCCNKKSKGETDDDTEGSEPLLISAAEKSEDDRIGSYYEPHKHSGPMKNASIGQSLLVMDESFSDIPDDIPKLSVEGSRSLTTTGNISIDDFFDQEYEIPTEAAAFDDGNPSSKH